MLFSSTLHLAISSNPSRLNPILATDSSSSEIAGFLFNGLVKYDENNSKIVGDLAKEFYFQDKTTLIFKLKKGIKWQDGVDFTTKDILFTYNTLLSDKVISAYTSNFKFVKSVEIVDALTLKVTYKKPYFKALEIWMMGILPYHILKDEKNMMSSKFNLHPIGTGAYKLQQFEYSKDIILSANKNYFEGKPKIDKISFHIVSDPLTRFLMLKSKK